MNFGGSLSSLFPYHRDPTRYTVANEFKDEHYRRIAYAIDHFTSSVIGWKSDRGRIYVMYGPPDSKTSSTAAAARWSGLLILSSSGTTGISRVWAVTSQSSLSILRCRARSYVVGLPVRKGCAVEPSRRPDAHGADGSATNSTKCCADGTHLGSTGTPATGENGFQPTPPRGFSGSRFGNQVQDLEAAVSSKITFATSCRISCTPTTCR